MPVQDYNPSGGSRIDGKRPLDPARCNAGVHYYIGNWPHYKQCENKAKADGYCGTHNPAKVLAREKASDERGSKKFRNNVFTSIYGRSGGKLAEALEKIRDGDNDPRTTAREILEAVKWDQYKSYRS